MLESHEAVNACGGRVRCVGGGEGNDGGEGGQGVGHDLLIQAFDELVDFFQFWRFYQFEY